MNESGELQDLLTKIEVGVVSSEYDKKFHKPQKKRTFCVKILSNEEAETDLIKLYTKHNT